jgi:hypothetical protein
MLAACGRKQPADDVFDYRMRAASIVGLPIARSRRRASGCSPPDSLRTFTQGLELITPLGPSAAFGDRV